MVLFLFLSTLSVGGRLDKKDWLDRALAKFAQSSWVVKYNQRLAMSVINSIVDDESEPNIREAPKNVQELGKRAQLAVGVPTSRLVPIKENPFKKEGGASAGYGSIVISSFYHEESYSVGRCNMYREAVHIKYNDHCTIGLVNSASLLSGLISGPLLVKIFNPMGKWKLLYPVFALVNAFITKSLLEKYYRRYIGRRADIEGHYATGCYICVHEKAEDVRGAFEIFQDILEEPLGLSKEEGWIEQQLTDKEKKQRAIEFFRAIEDVGIEQLKLTDEEKKQLESCRATVGLPKEEDSLEQLTDEEKRQRTVESFRAIVEALQLKLTDEEKKQLEFFESLVGDSLIAVARNNVIAVARNYIKNRYYYLSSDEKEQIASDLRRRNKVCSFHTTKPGAVDN